MRTVQVACEKSKYKVHIGRGLLDRVGDSLRVVCEPCDTMVVTDDNVEALYAQRVIDSLNTAGFTTDTFVFKHGEQSKSMAVWGNLLESMARRPLTRGDVIVALGGGVTGDLAGFAAATYLRGIRYVQLPTTLLAAVDSSVGGKTAVNLDAGKNLTGAFHQPLLVLCDLDTLNTLPEAVLTEGLAEVIKYGVIRDSALFGLLAEGAFMRRAEEITAACVKIKADIVGRDEFDTGERQLLNFGHTPAHAIEKLSAFGISHGHAVAMGMMLMTRAAERKKLTTQPCLEALERVLNINGLPTACPFSARELARAALGDKKRCGDSIGIVIPLKIGESTVVNIPVDELEDFFAHGL